jgi:serine/threonine-protein kinase HipA
MMLEPGESLRVSMSFAPGAEARVGRLGLAKSGVIFEYDPDFIRSPITLHALMPKSTAVVFAKNPRAFEGLPGVFADSLPDAWGRALLRRQTERRGIAFSEMTPLDRLACVGASGAGALTYRPDFPQTPVAAIDLETLAADALAFLDGNEDVDVSDLAKLGGSSGGARPKISVAMNASGAIVPASTSLPNGFDHWLVKFRTSSDPKNAGAIEAAYADMARAAGLDVVETRLLPSKSGPGFFATKRFDRKPGGRRLHMVSAAAMLETNWEHPADYETLLKLTRLVTKDQASVERVFRRAVFNVVASNRDDHLKQHAFLMDERGSWIEAPSFDLTLSPGPGGEHYLSVGGRGKDIGFEDLARLGAEELIDKQRVREIVDQTRTAVAEFAEFASPYGVDAATVRSIRRILVSGVSKA